MRAHVGIATLVLVVAALAVSAGTAFGASPTAFWHMDETSGSIAKDGTGNGYDGTIQKVKLGVPGVSKTGFEFNGSSSRILVKEAPGLRAGDKDLLVTHSVAVHSTPFRGYDLIPQCLDTSSGG